MRNFKIIPLSEALAAKIRETEIHPFGYNFFEQIANGKRPGRVSLEPCKIGI